MNKGFRDGENKAYAALVEFLWDEGDLSSFDSPEGVLRCFLDPERVDEVLEILLKPVEPPSEDGWYSVTLETPNGEEKRKLYYCRRYIRGCDPWWKGFLNYGETPVKHDIGIKGGEKVIGYSKGSSGDHVELFTSKVRSTGISQDVIDRLSIPYNLSAGWIKVTELPFEPGTYLTLFYDRDYPDMNVYEYGLGTEGSGWYDYEGSLTELVDYWRPLPQLPED